MLYCNVAQQLESQSTRTVVGKQSYIAPEQFRGNAVTQSDLYPRSHHFLLSYWPRSKASNMFEPFHCAVRAAALDAIVDKLTNLDAAQRYQRVQDLEHDLHNLRRETSG